MRLTAVFLIFSLCAPIDLYACCSPPSEQRALLQGETPAPILSKKLCCGLISIPITIAVGLLIVSYTAIKDDNTAPCIGTAFDDGGNVALTDWQVEIGSCPNNLPNSLSPFYCPANITLQQINGIVRETLPHKPANAICVQKANATAHNQTCVNFMQFQSTLTQTAQQCANGNSQRPNNRTPKRTPVTLRQRKAKNVLRPATHNRKPSKKQMFNSGR